MKHRSYLSLFVVSLFWMVSLPASGSATMLPRIANDIGATATRNIENSERLFCYVVSNKPQEYKGYTLDNMAIDGFCGIIDNNLKEMLSTQLFSTQDNIAFDHLENCTIQPRILLRFVRGIDNTDVLLSAPCYSMSIFYGGKVQTYNMKSAGHLLDTISNAFKTSQIKFISPALINQLLPIGVPQTAQQKSALSPQTAAKRSWSDSTNTSSTSSQGWNNLNFNK